MDIFKIHVFEDEVDDQLDIKLYIMELNKKLFQFKIKVVASYSDLTNVKEEIRSSDSNLILLDLIDDKSGEPLGKNAIKHNIKKIPTLIYTSKAGQVGFEINNEKRMHSFLVDQLTKSQENDFLQEYLFKYILDKKQGSLCFQLYNDNDLFLQLSLKVLGLNRVNSIISNINKDLNRDMPTIYPMSLGYSGAILFKLKYKHSEYILKMSKEIDKIKTEYENARKLYRAIPDRFQISIEPKEYFSYDKNVLGYFMNSVEDAKTLFEFILNVSNLENINTIFQDLFLNAKGLKDHYTTKIGNRSDWSSIFNKITGSKLLLITKSYNEVNLIVKKYHEDIRIDKFRRIAIENDYENLSTHNLLDDKYKKNTVLVHGDFHAKNIMIQDDLYIKIIDTGLMEYANWNSDISRLIVSLFIDGVDHNSVEYFRVESLEKYIVILKSITTRNQIVMDGKNDKIFTAINWLVLKVEEIYDSFELFEYHLGLMKEFLQVSYRFDTVPPNRRAFALIAADILMNEANINQRT